MLEIKIKYLTDIEPLKQIEIGDAIDVRSAVNISFKEGQSGVIPLGFSCKLPKGTFALLFPRSSTFKRYGLIETNSVGIIDESYCGDDDQWGFPFYALKGGCIQKGERIGQFILMNKMPPIQFTEVDHLSDENRGGFGSTGTM